MLDARAKAAYRARLEELREIVDTATAAGQPARAERARAEIESITDELARAVGLGGRDRKALDQRERARVNVTLRIRKAIKKVAELDEVVAHHLDTCVRTGTFCVYLPPPTRP